MKSKIFLSKIDSKKYTNKLCNSPKLEKAKINKYYQNYYFRSHTQFVIIF